ncbi:MAG: hypothetical protein PHV97_04470 [Candidatus Omnitrophica bacterium]|nr:hypothetical protein [Candidatus Omnitrophota bacterium]
MKKKCLSALIALCVLSAFPSVLNCLCTTGDCGLASRSIQSKTPQCHHANAPSKTEDGSRKECCGKCRIEKAAVLSNELSPVHEVRLRNTSAEIQFFSDFHASIRHPTLFQGEFFGSPPGFFEQHILNATFSFRAPPQG